MSSLQLRNPPSNSSVCISPIKCKTLFPFSPSHVSAKTTKWPTVCLPLSLPKLHTAVLANAAGKDVARESAEGKEELPDGLRRDLLPRHVAMVLDGNWRWARQEGLPARLAHRAGAQRAREIAALSREWGIRVLTLFGFSAENWTLPNPNGEVDISMKLFEEVINAELGESSRTGVRIFMIGDKSKLPSYLQTLISKAEEATKANANFQLVFGLNYSGRYDVVQAYKRIAEKVNDGRVNLENINSNLIEKELLTSCFDCPNPDLLIRPGGIFSMNNFMLWQLAFTEMYFVDKDWPDFDKADFVEALESFQKRERRFGG